MALLRSKDVLRMYIAFNFIQVAIKLSNKCYSKATSVEKIKKPKNHFLKNQNAFECGDTWHMHPIPIRFFQTDGAKNLMKIDNFRYAHRK